MVAAPKIISLSEKHKLQEEVSQKSEAPPQAFAPAWEPLPVKSLSSVSAVPTGSLISALAEVHGNVALIVQSSALHPKAMFDIVGPAIQMRDDFCEWLLDQAARLRSHRPAWLDWDNLAEELEAMAVQDRRTMKKQLRRVLLHFLKLQFQPERRRQHNGWRRSIRSARTEMRDILDDSLGVLQGKETELVADCYKYARKEASEEGHLPLSDFPEECPWTFAQITDADYFPGPRS